jgi:hypothetical protein
MQYRKMGSLDWPVSALGFGCMRLPSKRRFFWKKLDPDEAIRIIRRGIDRGVNYIDTAWFYHFGKSETIVGQALRDGYREKVRLVTKLPMILVRKTSDFDYYLHKQLEKLQTDYLDVYLFHALNQRLFDKMISLDLLAKMEEAKAKGLIRHIGFSFHDTLPVFKKIVDAYNWDVTLIQYNYMDTGIQATTEGLEYAHAKGIAVVIMEPIKGGMLANPPSEATEIIKNAPTQRTPVDWALQFLWNRPEVATVLSGMSSMQMVEQNCDSAERSGINSLAEDEIQILSQLAEIYRQKLLVPCSSCNYCMPCPAGVNIPENFAILNNVSLARQGDFAQRLHTFFIRRKYKKLARNKKQLAKKPNSGNASLCVNCGKCLEHCPQQIDIPTELNKTHSVLGQKQNIDLVFKTTPKPALPPKTEDKIT